MRRSPHRTLLLALLIAGATTSVASAEVFINYKTRQCGWFKTEREWQRELDVEIDEEWYPIEFRDGASLAPQDRNDEVHCRNVLDASDYESNIRKPCEVLKRGMKRTPEEFIRAYCAEIGLPQVQIPTRPKTPWYKQRQTFQYLGGIVTAIALSIFAFRFESWRAKRR